MTVRVYRSTDTSAPVLTGMPGKLVDLLDACLVNGYGTKATATLTGTGTNPANNETVTIGSTVYTFKTTLTGASYEVLIGANSDATLTNLRSAINDTGVEGTDYGTGTAAHPRVTCGAVAGNAVVITSIFFGTQDNTLATTETSAQLSWGGSTMSGGTGKDPSGWTIPYTSDVYDGSQYGFGSSTSQTSNTAWNPSITIVTGSYCLLAVLTSAGGGGSAHTVSTPSGWTALIDDAQFGTGTRSTFNLYGRQITTPGLTQPGTMTASTSVYWTMAYVSITGIPDLADAYVLAHGAQAAGTSVNSPSVTTAFDDDVVVAIIASSDNVGLTMPTGFSNQQGVVQATGDIAVALANKNFTTAGATGTQAWTKSADNGENNYTVSIAFKGRNDGSVTHKKIYRASSGNQRYLRVNDAMDLPNWTSGPVEAIAQMAESFGTYTSGTNVTPTTNILAIRKSASYDTTARPWVIIADQKRFYLLIQAGDTAGYWYLTHFGDFDSFVSGDLYNTYLMGRAQNTVANSYETATLQTYNLISANSSAREYVLRSYIQTGSGIQAKKISDTFAYYPSSSAAQNLVGSGANLAYPNPQDGGIYAAQFYIHETHSVQTSASIYRGKLTGFYVLIHDYTRVDDQSIFSGTGSYSGKQFQYFKNINCSSLASVGDPSSVLIEISDTW